MGVKPFQIVAGNDLPERPPPFQPYAVCIVITLYAMAFIYKFLLRFRALFS